jgi:hypothetical protein
MLMPSPSALSAVPSEHSTGVCLSLLKMSIKLDAFCDHAAHGRLADVQRMLESGEVLFEGYEFIALASAVKNGHVDIVDYLLRHAMFDPSARDNNNNNYATGLAAECGDLCKMWKLPHGKVEFSTWKTGRLCKMWNFPLFPLFFHKQKWKK